MLAVIVDAVIVFDLIHSVPGLNDPDTVFNREHRHTPVVVVASDDGAKAKRVDLPVPFGGFQERIVFLAVRQVVVDRRAFRDRIAVEGFTRVVAEGHEVVFGARQ
ncbi:hypothetical protein D3C76_745400 [compost metagenome]